MSKEKTPTGMSEEQLKTLALMMGRAQVSCMTEAIARAATTASGLADSLDRLKAIAEQFKDGALEEANVIPEVKPGDDRPGGWLWWYAEYPDEGSNGPFASEALARRDARLVLEGEDTEIIVRHVSDDVLAERDANDDFAAKKARVSKRIADMAAVITADYKGDGDKNIADRLKDGEIDFAKATDEVTSTIIETLESTWGGSKGCCASSSPSTTPRHIRAEWAGGESSACFTIYKSGRATTGGKGPLRNDIKAILEFQGFDVRC